MSPAAGEASRSFTVPGGTAVSVICVLLCAWLLANGGLTEIRDVSIATAIGIAVYAVTRLGQRGKV